MDKKSIQHIINREDLFFELNSILREHSVEAAAVISNCGIADSALMRYLSEMGVKTKDYDLNGISYDRENTDSLVRTIDCSGTQLIIAAGDGALLNAVKYLRTEGGSSDTPVLYCPSYVEAGDEANGEITFYGGEESYHESFESAAPEYVLYDPEMVEVGSKYRTNEHFARGICKGIDIMWSNDADSEASAEAAEGLSILLANATKIMRGERSSFADAFAGARMIGHASGLSESHLIENAALKLAPVYGIDLGHMMMKLAAPAINSVEHRLSEHGLPGIDDIQVEAFLAGDNSSEDKTALRKLKAIANIVAPGVIHVRSLSYQLRFLERALDLHEGDLGVQESNDIADSLDRELFRNWPVEMYDNDITMLLLHISHWDTLKRAVDRMEAHIKAGEGVKRNTEQLAALRERYKDDFSDDRIIQEPEFERQMQRREMVKGLQKDVLETLLLSKEFLESYGLRYYLSEGTLLGAVRHKGFIPWDDDVDIMMPREDYNRLVELDREGKVPPELHFDALENNPKHWVLGAKLQLTRESKYSQEKVKNLSEFNGPYIDVFPLDYWNSPYSKKQYRSQRIVKMCRRLLFMKTGYSRTLKWKWHRVLMLLSIPFIPNTSIEKLAIKHMTKFNDGNRKYMVHLCSYYRFYKEVFPTGFYGEPVYMEFEGHMFPVPKEYDYMLRTIYGNHYDSLPPARVAGLRNHPFEVVED